MISKELLSEVLNITVVCDDISNIELTANTITFIEDYWDEDEGSGFYRSHSINIYELAHKCKEWALDNGYYLTIHNDGIDVILQKSCKMVENITDGSFKYSPMLVFKACQWILDNAKTNSLS